MANWTLTSDDLPFGRREVSMSDSEMESIWCEFKTYKGSHKDFFLNKFGDKK